MDHERLNQDILNQMKMAREYHFLDMHVYTNALFSDHGVMLTKDIIYNHYSPGTVMEKDHHVHIFMWAVNIDMPNMIHMIRFISMCNNIVRRPVYIHIPKRFRSEVGRIKRILNTVYCDGRKIKYDIILENNTNVTKFFVQEAGYPGITPEEWLLICWDGRKYARPVYFLPVTNKTEEIFKEDAINGEN